MSGCTVPWVCTRASRSASAPSSCTLGLPNIAVGSQFGASGTVEQGLVDVCATGGEFVGQQFFGGLRIAFADTRRRAPFSYRTGTTGWTFGVTYAATKKNDPVGHFGVILGLKQRCD